jgi:hypothetical protein
MIRTANCAAINSQQRYYQQPTALLSTANSATINSQQHYYNTLTATSTGSAIAFDGMLFT